MKPADELFEEKRKTALDLVMNFLVNLQEEKYDEAFKCLWNAVDIMNELIDEGVKETQEKLRKMRELKKELEELKKEAGECYGYLG